MSNKLEMKNNSRVSLLTSVESYTLEKALEDLLKVHQDGFEFAKALMDYVKETPGIPKNERFSFEIDLARYNVIEEIIRTGRIPEWAKPPEPIPVLDPVWTMDSNLGSYNYDDEVYIPLLFDDVSGVVTNVTLVGSLPMGVSLNAQTRSIYGYIEDSQSTSYTFTLRLHTSTGNVIPMEFTMNTVVTTSSIEWETDGDLGSYAAGSVVSQSIDAYPVDEG
jgi:hypothetical protein